VAIHLDNGRDFIIEAQNVSEENKYIRAAYLNDEYLNRAWFEYSILNARGTLILKMGPNTNKDRSSTVNERPSSITEKDPKFVIKEFKLSSTNVRINEPLTIATVIKKSGSMGIKELKLYVNGKYAQSKWVMLENGECRKESLSLRLYEPGMHKISLDSLAS